MINGIRGDAQTIIYLILLISLMFPSFMIFPEARKRTKMQRLCRKLKRSYIPPTVYDKGGQFHWRSRTRWLQLANPGSKVDMHCLDLAYRIESFQRINLNAPYLTIRWTKYDQTIGSQKRFKIFGCQERPFIMGSRLQIRRVKLSDSGIYSCQVIQNDTATTVKQRMYMVLVRNHENQSPPVKLFNMTDLSTLKQYTNKSCLNTSETVHLSCRYLVNGSGRVNITWTKIINRKETQETLQGEQEVNVSCAASQYICSVQNAAGGFKHTFFIDGPQLDLAVVNFRANWLTSVMHLLLFLPLFTLGIAIAVTYMCQRRLQKTYYKNVVGNGMFVESIVEHRLHDLIEKEPEPKSCKTQHVDTAYYALNQVEAFPAISKDAIELVGKKEISRERLAKGWKSQMLGSGYFGHVYKGYLISSCGEPVTPVAVKVLREGFRPCDLKAFVEEAKTIIQSDHHQNVISLVGTCILDYLSADRRVQQAPMLLMELAEGGNLRSYVVKFKTRLATGPAAANRTFLDLGQLLSFAHQVSLGMEHLSNRKILHRDLAARNILLTKDKIVKIGDFGLSKQMENKNYYRACSRWEKPAKWTAPEALLFDKYSVASDIWSYGVLLWEIFALGDEPYPEVEPKYLYNFLRQGLRLPQPQFASKSIYEIMQNCWKWNPNDRTDFSILSNFFREYQVTEGAKIAPENPPIVTVHRDYDSASIDPSSNSEDAFSSNCYLAGLFSASDTETEDLVTPETKKTFPNPLSYVPSELCFAERCTDGVKPWNIPSTALHPDFAPLGCYSTKQGSENSADGSSSATTSKTSFEVDVNDPFVFENQTYIKPPMAPVNLGFSENDFAPFEESLDSSHVTSSDLSSTGCGDFTGETCMHYGHIIV